MKSWQFTVVGVACLAMAGCLTDPSVAILTRQNRLLEDEVYRLRGIIEDCQTQTPSDYSPATDLREPSQPLPPARQIPAAKAPAAEAPAWTPPTVEVPSQEILREKEPEQLRTPPGRKNQGPDLPGGQPSGDAPKSGDTSHAAPIRPADNRRVARLVLNRRLTGGYDADGLSGDDGVRAVIEPRDAQGRWIAAGADVSVVVLDPALEGESTRVARWDFTAAETAHLVRRTGLGRAIQLDMVWPAAPPVHEQLHLFVRYTTSDGRRLEADGPIRINLADRHVSGWVPAKQPAPRLQVGRHVSFQAPVRPPRPSIRRPVWSPDRQ